MYRPNRSLSAAHTTGLYAADDLQGRNILQLVLIGFIADLLNIDSSI